MSYDRSKLTFALTSGSAMLGWRGVTLGVTRLGLTTDTRTVIPVAAVALNDGYTVGDRGELSIDPSTATATLSEHATGTPTPGTPPLRVGDRIEIAYDMVVLLRGMVTAVTCDLKPGDAFDLGYDFTRTWTYTIASIESLLLTRVATWDPLPAESALVRLRRHFTVSTAAVAAAHLPYLDVEVPAADAGSATMLDLARQFTAATLLPLRIDPGEIADYDASISVFDTSIAWPDQALTPVITGSTGWVTSAGYASADDGTLAPTTATVTTDDTRFTGGQSTITITPAHLTSTFRLGTSRLGSSTVLSVGFHAGGVVDVLGAAVAVSRLQQRFAEHYDATLELAPRLEMTAT